MADKRELRVQKRKVVKVIGVPVLKVGGILGVDDSAVVLECDKEGNAADLKTNMPEILRILSGQQTYGPNAVFLIDVAEAIERILKEAKDA